MTFHDPGSGVPLVPCNCGGDCELVATDCCTDTQRECETELTTVLGWEGEVEDRFRTCLDGFGCQIPGVPV